MPMLRVLKVNGLRLQRQPLLLRCATTVEGLRSRKLSREGDPMPDGPIQLDGEFSRRLAVANCWCPTVKNKLGGWVMK